MQHTKTIVPVTASIAILCILAVWYTPSRAQERGENLLQTILNYLTSIEAELTDPQNGLAEIKSEVAGIEDKVGKTARVVVVQTTIETVADSTRGVNLDVAAGLLFGKLKRYTVSIQLDSLTIATAGLNNISVHNGVLGGSAAFDIVVFSDDPSALASSAGVVVPPYVGTNSFITVTRGLDGMGPVGVHVNAYIELEH